MAKEKRTYSAESRTAKSLKLRPRPSRDERTGQPSIYRDAEGDYPFSREVIQRLIDWFKQD
jgi:hypothetical protein